MFASIYIAATFALLLLVKMRDGGQISSQQSLLDTKSLNLSSSRTIDKPANPDRTLNASSSQVQTPKEQKPGVVQRVAAWFRKLLPFPLLSRDHGYSDGAIPLSGHTLESGFRSVRIGDVDGAYSNPFAPTKLRGVALLFHGCSQNAEDWFSLPEHKLVSSELLRQRFALLALTSQNRVTGCWSTRFPSRENEDVMRVKVAVRQWMTEHQIASAVPITALGVSSGATMLSVLAHELPIASQALYISPGNQRALRNASDKYPSTLFVHLATDQYYAPPSSIAAARRTLVRRNVALVGELSLPNVPFTATTFHDHEPQLTKEVSQRLYEAAQRNENKIAKVLRGEALTKAAIRRGALQIARVLRGGHELSALHADKVAKWLGSQLREVL
ncbi:hypothetical protein BWQ96_01817 [Gracilariopsis chorda]|uniref:Alpha/beta hydrolase n=1 Tax=Gracilariopsis chorda TaxID=448386 RepID=A0A2V3J2Y5_9FLOR|nr:hypothetical protein BWQ96_01817 [Gracilariopsis chorda]|eukprot:PXF48357.1 hypothetical protein BWQ96_01817 [Gracilariopsis chorda]